MLKKAFRECYKTKRAVLQNKEKGAIANQRRIVAYLDDLQAKVNSLKRLQTETQKELDALMPSVLDKAFKGAL